MKIIVDAMGGDNAPLEIIKGSMLAVDEYGIDELVLLGDEAVINNCVKDNGIALKNTRIVNCTQVIDNCDDAKAVLRGKPDSSMAVGFKLLNDGEGDAFVSAGSTGALVVGSTFIAKRLIGIKRAALAPIMPAKDGYFMLLDGGANSECRPDALVQFAVMGSAYMEKVMNIKNPRVGLLNIGAEETKGRELEIETYKLLEKAPLNFTGNVEARDLPFSKCDVVVTDGYTGNIALKLYEGMGLYFGKTLKNMLTSNIKTKLAALLLTNQVNAFKKSMDYSEVGGAVLMGISGTVIKAHGSSDGKAFYNAIRQAKECVEAGVTDSISAYIESQKGGE